MPEVHSPTVRRRELGVLLRALRQERGLTVEQAAEELLCSPSKVSRMEAGQRGATLRDVRDLCRLYGVTDQIQVDRLMDLARGGKEQGWWQSYDLDPSFSPYVGLEAEAMSTKHYQSTVIPGLLQTADYARAVHEAVRPAPDEELINQRVKVRLMRQELLKRDPPLLVSAILDEAALHRAVGGATIMQAQLQHLIKMSQLPNVTVRVIPYSAGAHEAMDSNFRILDFGSAAVPNVVYVEGLVGFIYLHLPQKVRTYEEVFEGLAELALSPEDSVDLVMALA